MSRNVATLCKERKPKRKTGTDLTCEAKLIFKRLYSLSMGVWKTLNVTDIVYWENTDIGYKKSSQS